MAAERRAGITLPLFSLRAEHDSGIGEYDDLIGLVEWCAKRGQRLVALLPLGELGRGEYSPYNALSSFALDPSYLRPASIAELRGLAPAPPEAGDSRYVDRERARSWKEPLFSEGFRRFRQLGPSHPRRTAFEEFRRRSDWLADYALFRALLEAEDDRSWIDWPEALRRREPAALDEARRRLADRIEVFEYLQFACEDAWRDVRRGAATRGVWLLGDLPFAPSENSADVWAHPEVFDLSRSVGAPPDAFSATGQRWGLPMIRWQAMRESGWQWLRRRVRRMAELYDAFRIDHVVGLFRTFSFRDDEPLGFDPSAEPQQLAQGREILEIMREEARPALLVAEDLGMIPKFVTETLSTLGIPGYKVLRWERSGERMGDPLGYPECSIATTGTHDTDTLAEWWLTLVPAERRELARLVGAPAEHERGELTTKLRRAILGRLYRSPSRLAILPIQDLFGWRGRVNTPATIGRENWTYRLPVPVEHFAHDAALEDESNHLFRLIDASGRLRKMGVSS